MTSVLLPNFLERGKKIINILTELSDNLGTADQQFNAQAQEAQDAVNRYASLNI
jgi:hypothetical protein